MKTKFYLPVILLFINLYFSYLSNAQNLVPNWSFEDTVSCPIGGGQVNLAIGWSSYRSSPDYCHSCSNYFNSVPNNQWGFQFPKTGDAYAGLIIAHTSVVQNSREFIGIELSQSLILGEKYFISFYTSMAFNNISNLSGLASNKLGLKFSTIPYTAFSNPASIDNFTHIYTDSIITDYINWTKISGSFIADSSYQFVIIGNFFTDSLTSTISFNANAHHAYYYIDDVRISTDSLFVNSIEEYETPEILNIFPNPARDWITVEGRNIKSIEVLDLSGRIIIAKMKTSSFRTQIDISLLSHGLYFVRANTINQSFIQKFIHY